MDAFFAARHVASASAACFVLSSSGLDAGEGANQNGPPESVEVAETPNFPVAVPIIIADTTFRASNLSEHSLVDQSFNLSPDLSLDLSLEQSFDRSHIPSLTLPYDSDFCGSSLCNSYSWDSIQDFSSELSPFDSAVNQTQFDITHEDIDDFSVSSTISTASLNNYPIHGHNFPLWSALLEHGNEVTHTENANVSMPVVEPAYTEQGSPGNEKRKLAEGAPEGLSVNGMKGQVERSDSHNRKCSWPGCSSNTIFKRKYEYDRHMKKHTKVISIPCPVEYCPRQGSRSFYRWDKLFDHLRTGHTEDEKCRCLVEGCTAVHMPLNLLRLHARYHSIDVNKSPNLAASYDFLKVLRSFSLARKCDLKKCKRWFSAAETNHLQEHLLSHSLDDRLSQRDIIREMGYDPTTIRIICPMCDQNFADSAQFIPHLETAHVSTNVDHWLSFKRQVPTDNPTTPQYIWQGWVNKDGASEESYCHYCGNYASSQGNDWIDHHLELLKVSDEILAARARILRLLPDFAEHPVFEIDVPTVHRA